MAEIGWHRSGAGFGSGRSVDVIPDDAAAVNAGRPFNVNASSIGSKKVWNTDLGQRYGIRRHGIHSGLHIYEPVNVYEFLKASYAQEGYSEEQALYAALEGTEEYVDSKISENMTKAIPSLQSGLMKVQRMFKEDMQKLSDIGSSNNLNSQNRTPNGMRLSGLGNNPNARDASRRVAPVAPSEEQTFSFVSADGKEYTFNKTQNGVIRNDFVAFLSILASIEVERGGRASTVYVAARVSFKDNGGQTFFSAKEVLDAQEAVPALPDGMSFEEA